MAHCLLMPLAMLVLPIATSLDALHDSLHPIMAVALLPVTLAAIRTWRRRPAAAFLLLLGLVLIWGAVVHHETETEMTVAGSSALIAGHLLRLAGEHASTVRGMRKRSRD